MKIVWGFLLGIVLRYTETVEDVGNSFRTTTIHLEDSTSYLNEMSAAAEEVTNENDSTDAIWETTSKYISEVITTQYGSGDNIGDDIAEETTTEDIAGETLGEDKVTDVIVESSLQTTSEITFSIVSIADYTFSSSGSEISIQLELLTDGTVRLVCEFKAENETITFGGDKGAPQIWLIRNHRSCFGLTGKVFGQQLGTINKSGQETDITTLTWDQLPGNCLLLLQRKEEKDQDDIVLETEKESVIHPDKTTETVETAEAQVTENATGITTEVSEDATGITTEVSEDATGIITEVSKDTTGITIETSEDVNGIITTEVSEDATGIATRASEDATVIDKLYSRSGSVLTIYPTTRTFRSLDLSLFSVFGSGSTGAFNLPSVVISKPPAFYPSHVVSVPYNKWSTLPYLQLSGWSTATSYYIAWAMFALYYIIALSSAGPTASLLSLGRRISGVLEDNNVASRVDHLQVGLVDIIYEAINNVNPYDNPQKHYYRKPVQMY